MNDKDVLRKLNSLRDLKPAADWKTSSRELLLAQISNSSDQTVKVTLVDEVLFEVKSFFSFFSQPAFAALGLFVLVAGSVFGAGAARNARPGDSFYAVKLWGEKAKVATTFDSKDKAKLEMKLASARAKEISAVLSDPQFNNEENKKKVEQLSESFKTEIQTVKQKYEEINKVEEPKVAAAPIMQVASSNVEMDDVAIGIGASKKDNQKVVVADSNKATSGIQISQPDLSVQGLKAVGAPVVEQPASSTTQSDDLTKAEASFATKDFSGAIDSLDKFISNIDNGEVKGVSETATSVSDQINTGAVSSSSDKK